ncbi:hypothetical protein DdX_16000 [Ditylenchus destructor]|uniref:Uncharacterized protein n=1 Tax=Ditylenchus destructor TaxID=166010 RepID=A0AAD4MRR1_9BILA|nr:hypothetical protein DdX_16000 [Ditylenchus destructor]
MLRGANSLKLSEESLHVKFNDFSRSPSSPSSSWDSSPCSSSPRRTIISSSLPKKDLRKGFRSVKRRDKFQKGNADDSLAHFKKERNKWTMRRRQG